MIRLIVGLAVWLHDICYRLVRKWPWRSVNSKRWDRHADRWLLVVDENVNFIEAHDPIENLQDTYGTFEFSLIMRDRIDACKQNARLALALYQEALDAERAEMWMSTYKRYRKHASDWRKEMRDSDAFAPKRNFLNWYYKMEKELGRNVPWPPMPKCAVY